MRTVLTLLAATTLAAAEPAYDLHEWGVFTVAPGNPLAQQDFREEWASFPTFFTKRPPLPQNLLGTVIVRKPVIFLQAEGDLSVDLSVTFTGGAPMVWWPEAAVRGTSLDFSVGVWDLQQVGRRKGPQLVGPPVPAGHWLEHLRAGGGDFLLPINREEAGRKNVSPGGDSFLYYDGLLPVPAVPTIAVTDGDRPTVTVTNPATYPLLDVILIWKRDGRVQVSLWRDSLDAGAKVDLPMWPIAPLPPVGGPVGATPKPYDVQVRDRLVAAGLTENEAASLVACWYDDLFVNADDGLTLLHRLPQEVYERMLPLTAKPAPRAIVRVGLMAFRHLEPTLQVDVEALITRLGATAPADQPPLIARLKAYGGAAFPLLRDRISKGGPEVDLWRRLLAEQEMVLP